MTFDFTEDQELLRESIDEAARELIGPFYKERAVKEEYCAPALAKSFEEMGILGFDIPEEYGGNGVKIDAVTVGLIVETLGKYDISAAALWYNIYITSKLVGDACTEEQKAYWYPIIAKGHGACGLFTEPQCGSDLAKIKTYAKKVDGGFIINGTKASVTAYENHYYQVLAVVDEEIDPSCRAVFMFDRTQTTGVSFAPYTDFGLKERGRGDVYFNDVFVPDSAWIKGEDGFRTVMREFDIGRPAIALFSIASAMSVLEESLNYVKQRNVFDKPLSKFEAVSFGFAEHYAKLESARYLAFRAMELKSQGKRNTKEAAMSKFYGCEAAVDAIWFGTRVLGHVGYTTEYAAILKLADAMGYAWGDGAWETCKMIAAREIGGKDMLPYDKPANN